MAKSPRTPTGRAARGHQGRSTPARMWLAGVAVAILVVAGVWVANRDRSGGTEVGHVHGLGLNPADGQLYLAAHNGLFRLDDTGTVQRVGDGAQDTMGFTIAGPDHFLASGHPAPLAGGPDHLGLVESFDGGVSWRTVSLSGEADFHALAHRHDTIYGYNALTGQFLASQDGAEWDTRSQVALFDVAVSPTNPDLVLGTTETGLIRSTDGGRTWTPSGGPEVVLLLAWPAAGRLWGVTATGQVLRSADPAGRWSTTGQAPGTPSAFAADGDHLYLAVVDEGIHESGDGGATWDRLHP